MIKKIDIKKLNFFLILFVFSNHPIIKADVFKFQFIPGSKQKIEAKITGKLYQNQKFVTKYDQTYKTIRSCKDTTRDIGTIDDIYYFYNQNTLVNNQVLEIKDESTVTYTKDQQGYINVNNNGQFPTFRDVPVFPEKDIKPKDQWIVAGYEVQDLFNDGYLSILPIQVTYTFLGYEKKDGINLAKFKYEHQIAITNNLRYNIDPKIKQIEGESTTILYFNNETGSQVKEEYSRDYAFLINNGNQQYIAEFIDTGERLWFPIELMNKNKVIDDIKKQLEKDKIEDAKIEKDDKGVKLSIENLHFYPDSTQLLPQEQERLKKIAGILKNYKDKGVMVIGHTTDKGTEKNRLKLSIDRAKKIIDYLIDLNAINPAKSSFGGKGGTEPIADNSTEEGMEKNRRVEIYILEE